MTYQGVMGDPPTPVMGDNRECKYKDKVPDNVKTSLRRTATFREDDVQDKVEAPEHAHRQVLNRGLLQDKAFPLQAGP